MLTKRRWSMLPTRLWVAVTVAWLQMTVSHVHPNIGIIFRLCFEHCLALCDLTWIIPCIHTPQMPGDLGSCGSQCCWTYWTRTWTWTWTWWFWFCWTWVNGFWDYFWDRSLLGFLDSSVDVGTCTLQCTFCFESLFRRYLTGQLFF